MARPALRSVLCLVPLLVVACNLKSRDSAKKERAQTSKPDYAKAIPPSGSQAAASSEAPPSAAAPAAPAAAPADPAVPAEPSEPALPVVKGDVLGLPYGMLDLDNGLRAVAVKTDIPDVVSLQIVVRVGSRNEVEAGKSGFAHFFEHMMFRGTEKYPSEIYSSILKRAGADQNAYTSDDLTNYHITFTKADLDAILEVEADRFKNLEYSEDQFRTEALAVKGEYLKNYSNPLMKMLEKLRSLAFTTHPYRHTTMGFLEDIEAMPDQLEYSKTFFDRFYRPNNTVLLLVGDVEPESVLAKVQARFGDWEPGSYEAEIPEEPAPAGPQHAHVQWEAPTQPWLLLGFRGPAFDASTSTMPALDAVATLAFSEASPLYRKLVIEEQWVDELISWFPKRRDPGLLHIGARLLKPEYAGPVRDAIYQALNELRDAPLDPTWIERTKSRLRYETARSLEDSSSAAGTIASLVHFDRTPDTLDALFERYAELTPRSVLEAAKTYFTDARRFLVTLSNGTALPTFDPAVGLDAATSTAATAASTATSSTAAPFFAGSIETSTPPAPTTTSTVGVAIRTKLMPSKTSPLVTLSFVFTAGAAFDPPGKKGLAALTAAMIADGGTKDLSISAINEAMYPMAASFDWQVDKEMLRLSGTVHQDNLDAFYGFASAQLLDPGFRAEDLERNKKKMLSAIRTDLVANNDEELAKEVLYEFIYGRGHPYASYNLGISSDVEKLTLEDVESFYRDHFRARGVLLGIAGGYPASFPARVKKDLAGLTASDEPVIPLPKPPRPEGRRALIIEKKTPGVAVSAGFPISVRRGDPDWVALWLVRSWLGEHRSSNSHLYQEIREKRGMNYGDYAYIEYFPRGMYQFHPDANLARRQQIFQIWLRPFRNNVDAHFGTRLAIQQLEDLVEKGLTKSEFEATRSYLRKFVSLLTQTQARQLGYGIDAAFYGTPEFSSYVRRGLDGLTLEAVNGAVRRHLDPSRMSFVFVSRDAASLLRRLAREMPSPIEYNSPKPELEAVDKKIATKRLGFDAVTFVPVDEIF